MRLPTDGNERNLRKLCYLLLAASAAIWFLVGVRITQLNMAHPIGR